MAIVTDPDSLDRWQVLVDYFHQRIGIKPVGTVVVSKLTDGATDGTKNFSSAGGDFVNSGVAVNDILVLVEGIDINHYTITGGITATSVGVSPVPSGTESNLTYRVQEPTGGTTTDGATLQSIYSFLKEEWRTQETDFPDLFKHTFPLESITREQFEIGGTTHEGWDWRDDDTRNLIRTGGWAQINSTGLTETRYAGVITLGALDSDAQAYYLQSAGGTPSNFVLTGPVNQAIKIYDVAGDDQRTFLKLFARKKARSYADAEIADIGVTTLETIVNRFPLTHSTDPAIVSGDGGIAGANPGIWQSVTDIEVGHTDGILQDSNTTDGILEFASTTANFTNLIAGDTVEIHDGPSATNRGIYEIQSISGANGVYLFQEPGVDIVPSGGISFTGRTRMRAAVETNGYTTDLTGSGLWRSAGSDYAGSGAVAGDILHIYNSEATLNGVYQVLGVSGSDGLYIETTDQTFTAQSSQTGVLYQPGMHLQYKSTHASGDTMGTVTFNDRGVGPDDITRSVGSFITDGFTHGMAITVSNAGTAANNGTYIVNIVTATGLTLIAEESLTDDGSDTTAVILGENGFVRTLNAVDYPFNWRLFGNNASLANCFQYVQRQLRRTTDIDLASGVSRGDITDLLMTYAAPNATTINLFIDDLLGTEFNNATMQDLTGDSRNFAFIAGVTISLNTNITSSTSAKVVVFFTNDDAGDNNGYDFGTDNAIIVQDVDSNPMQDTTPLTSPLTFNFDYDNNAQRGAASAGQDAPVTIVAIGTDTAQYVQTVGTIARQSDNVFSLVATLERNYST